MSYDYILREYILGTSLGEHNCFTQIIIYTLYVKYIPFSCCVFLTDAIAFAHGYPKCKRHIYAILYIKYKILL